MLLMMINGCTKFEQDMLNIVGCRSITRAGQTKGQMDACLWRICWCAIFSVAMKQATAHAGSYLTGWTGGAGYAHTLQH